MSRTPAAHGLTVLYDLGRTFAAWRAQPMLPLTALAAGGLLAFAASLTGGRTGLLLVLLPLYVGFFGAQRVWYARAWEGGGLSPGRVLRLSAGFVWEYVALLLVMVAAGAVLALPLLWIPSGAAETYVAVTGLCYVVFVDVLCTFATSAIAIGDKAVGDAVSTSARLLRAGFPHCLPHALLPPLVLYDLSDGRPGRLVAAEVFAFVARGVTTSYYVRATALPPVPPELEVKRNPVMFH